MPLMKKWKSITRILRGQDSRTQYLDQGVSSITNYLPLLIVVVAHDWKSLGLISLFQSFYSLFVGVTRSALGITSIMNPEKYFGKTLLLFSLIVGILGGAISWSVSRYMGFGGIFYLFLMILPLLEETLRFQAIAFGDFVDALVADAIWMIGLILFSVYIIFGSNQTYPQLLIAWSISSAPAFIFLNTRIRPGDKIKANIFDRKYFKSLRHLGAISLLSEINTIAINIIITALSGALILGHFRFYQLCFIPIAFLINANRTIFIPLIRNANQMAINSILKSQLPIRILTYCIGIFFVFQNRGFNFSELIIAIIVATSVEFAFQRNLQFQRLIALEQSGRVQALMLRYLFTSILVFSISVPSTSILKLSLSLLLVEFIALVISTYTVRRFDGV